MSTKLYLSLLIKEQISAKKLLSETNSIINRLLYQIKKEESMKTKSRFGTDFISCSLFLQFVMSSLKRHISTIMILELVQQLFLRTKLLKELVTLSKSQMYNLIRKNHSKKLLITSKEKSVLFHKSRPKQANTSFPMLRIFKLQITRKSTNFYHDDLLF